MLTRRSRNAAERSAPPPAREKFRIVIVETTSGNEVQLCNSCTHRVGELQHDNAAFALKSSYEPQRAEHATDEEVIGDLDGNGTADYSDVENSFKKDLRQTRSRKRSPKAIKRKSAVLNTSGAVDESVQPPKVVFPESDYDVLEKRLISLESELQQAADNDQFKKLCKMGVMCEERWARMYCKDYGKSWDEYRNEAISVLKHNLDIRRDGLRPFMKMQNKANGVESTPRLIKRDILTVAPSVSIAMGRMGNPQDYRGPTGKRIFAVCVPINNLSTAPLSNYSYVEQDPCFMIENALFEVEHRLKRCDRDSKEFNELLEEGRRLREEWRAAAEDLKRGKSVEAEPPGYDIRKCVVVGRNRKRDNSELMGAAADEGAEDINVDITH
ncbi:hypothetical protein M3Y99_00789700 [Aphelenchoides fujianensis]|nr:hypothetical protein M3Y99_00789700 [Aphelenchoides fujianensis]